MYKLHVTLPTGEHTSLLLPADHPCLFLTDDVRACLAQVFAYPGEDRPAAFVRRDAHGRWVPYAKLEDAKPLVLEYDLPRQPYTEFQPWPGPLDLTLESTVVGSDVLVPVPLSDATFSMAWCVSRVVATPAAVMLRGGTIVPSTMRAVRVLDVASVPSGGDYEISENGHLWRREGEKVTSIGRFVDIRRAIGDLAMDPNPDAKGRHVLIESAPDDWRAAELA